MSAPGETFRHAEEFTIESESVMIETDMGEASKVLNFKVRKLNSCELSLRQAAIARTGTLVHKYMTSNKNIV